MPPSKPSNKTHSKITLEELVALNDEIIALVRAGVPLELGLQELGEDRAGALGRLGTRLATRLSRGESLPDALGQEDIGLPKAYRVIVEAGLRAGRLTVALEGVSQLAFRISELRRRIGAALVYPLIVLMFAYGLFTLFVTQLAPRMEFTFESFGIFPGHVLDLLTDLGRDVEVWGWILPACVVGLVLWWRRSGHRWLMAGDGTPSRLTGLCPGLGKIARNFRYAQFADLLALLVEQNVPMGEALILAADTTNDRTMQESARAIAEVTARGQVVPNALPGYAGFPPFLHWLITRREEQKGLVPALRAAADTYRRRAVLMTEWIKIIVPVLAAVVIGGGATLIYALTVFWPLTELLHQLAAPMV